ncbi:MAG: ATP-binding protein [Candidatus Latescibacteria bacterium]|nr:ATP-binding protein [Candidatus Latescibacterota bacterium]
MERLITKKLLTWKNRDHRKPLILRGARQVGKTWSVLEFGKNYFNGHVHVVDLEQHSDWHRIFERNLVAERILSELEILLNARIVPGEDLLFFDEIQACPRAIMALRYFYEAYPELHVIAAGSLLEFATRGMSFPVGRVQFLDMAPMSFVEFLWATGKTIAADIVLSPPERHSDQVHTMLLDEVRRYLFIGGMPECVREYVRTGSIRDAFEVQAELVHAYRQDFSKYAPHSDNRCLSAVLSSTAQRVGQQIKYAHLTEGYSNPTIKKAFDLLCLAQVIRKVASATPSGLPLGASASARKFKALMVDIGIMQHLCGLPVDVEYKKSDLLSIYRGALAEQFVGQELVAAGHHELYYWAREARSSRAEVDFLMVLDGRIYAIEVKSGASGRLRSLHLLLQTYPNCGPGYVFSCAPYSELPEQKLVFLPLYYVYGAASVRCVSPLL